MIQHILLVRPPPLVFVCSGVGKNLQLIRVFVRLFATCTCCFFENRYSPAAWSVFVGSSSTDQSTHTWISGMMTAVCAAETHNAPE